MAIQTSAKLLKSTKILWSGLELETNDFSHLLAIARFHIRYFSEDINITVVSNVFGTIPINVLLVYHWKSYAINYFAYNSNARKISRKYKKKFKINIDGKVLKRGFNFLVNEVKLFHLYYFELSIKKII